MEDSPGNSMQTDEQGNMINIACKRSLLGNVDLVTTSKLWKTALL
jgi:hypothetical protein